MIRSLRLVPMLLALAACTTTAANPTTFNFDRPSDVALVCLRVELVPLTSTPTGQTGDSIRRGGLVMPEPLGSCQSRDSEATFNHPASQFPCRDSEPNGPVCGFRMFALVTQSDRGELAVVNVHPDRDFGPVDNDRRVPGFTFIPVGPFPSALAVDPRGLVTYIANSGGRTVSVIDNTKLLSSSPHRETRDGDMSRFVELEFEGAPSDLVTFTRSDGRVVLYVAIPDLGRIEIVDITDPGAPQFRMPLHLASIAPNGGGLDGGGTDASGMDGGFGAEAGMSGVSRPSQIALADDGRLYVSDRGVPIIHVLFPSDGPELLQEDPNPLLPPDTTHVIAVTPAVRSQGSTHYVYAAQRNDARPDRLLNGTMMVFDTSSTNRRPIDVNLVRQDPACNPDQFDAIRCSKIDPRLPFDRLPLLAPVRSMTFIGRHVIEPGTCTTSAVAPVQNCTAGAPGGDPIPRTMRGIQALIATRSGQLQVIDVEDPDRNCAPGRVAVMRDTPPRFQPHLPRSSAALLAAPTMSSPPIYVVGGVNVAPAADQPRIVDIDNPAAACVEPMIPPMATAGRYKAYCVSLPPSVYQVRDETWSIISQGSPPGLAVDTASFRPEAGSTDLVRLVAPGIGFCTRGALEGDTVTLPNNSPLSPEVNVDAGAVVRPDLDDASTCNMMVCAATFGNVAAPCNRDLTVVRATEDDLVLRVAPGQSCGPMLSAEELRSRLACCYPQATRVEVRLPLGTWMVVGGRSGYLHDVIVDPADPINGQCVRSPMRFPAGRLVEGATYESQAFNIRLASGVTTDAMGRTVVVPAPRSATFQFTVTGGFFPLAIDGGLLPNAALYSCPNQRLYVVDQARNSLYEYSTFPIDRPRSFN